MAAVQSLALLMVRNVNSLILFVAEKNARRSVLFKKILTTDNDEIVVVAVLVCA